MRRINAFQQIKQYHLPKPKPMKALLADQSIEAAKKIYPEFNQIMAGFQQELNNR